jgi:hypothetical protein
MKYIFLAETNTSRELMAGYLTDFLDRMLKLDTKNVDIKVLDLILEKMEVFVDIGEDRIILVYKDIINEGDSKQTHLPYGI